MKQKQYTQTLTPSVFYILFSLSSKPRHGYQIMKQVENDSDGKIKMGPGTLYGSVKRMIADGLIEEAYERPDPEFDDERRRYYRLTEFGRKQLLMELERYQNTLRLASRKNLIKGFVLQEL